MRTSDRKHSFVRALSFLVSCLVPLVFGCGSDTGSQAESQLGLILQAEDARGEGPLGLDPILEGLASADPEVQQVAGRALGRLENPELVPQIARLLDSDHAGVRLEAVNALGQAVFRSDGEEVAGLLRTHLTGETNPSVRGTIGRTLGRMRYQDPSFLHLAEESLLDIITGSEGMASPEQLLGAAMGLEWLTRRNRGYAIQESTRDRLASLAGLHPSTSGMEEKTGNRLRRVSLMALSASGNIPDPVMAGALEDPDPDVRRIALAHLARNPATRGALAAAEAAMGDPSPRVRTQAVATFGALGSGSHRCRVILDATQDQDPMTAVTAIDLLQSPCPDATGQIPVLKELAQDYEARSPTRWHRGAHALVALVGVSPETAAPLIPEVSGHTSPFARVYAARAAARLGDLEVLEALTDDPVGNVRAAALQGLFRIQGHDSDEQLLAQLDQDDPGLFLTVSGLLAGTPGPNRIVGPLLRAFSRVSSQGRETARDPRMALLERIAEVAGPELEDELTPYLDDYDPLVAQEVAELLSEWTGREFLASPEPAPALPLPSLSEIEELGQTRIIMEMEGGGNIEIGLFAQLAPTNAARFARLAADGYFDGLTFHRIVSNFVVQGGSPHANEMSGDGPYTRDEIGLQSNWRGTVGTSTRGRDTGDGQIFINLVDNLRLDHNYTIFGEVVAGMDVVDGLMEGDVIQRVRVMGPS